MPNFNLDNYVPVHERLARFYKDCPDGRVNTSIVEHDREKGFVLIEARIFKTLLSERPTATGHAFEERAVGYVNKTSYIENAETSAVGRALALMGYEIERGIASREEIEKVERYEKAEALKVTSENGNYKVGTYTVSKPNGKVQCSCSKKAGCEHIQAVHEFVDSAN